MKISLRQFSALLKIISNNTSQSMTGTVRIPVTAILTFSTCEPPLFIHGKDHIKSVEALLLRPICCNSAKNLVTKLQNAGVRYIESVQYTTNKQIESVQYTSKCFIKSKLSFIFLFFFFFFFKVYFIYYYYFFFTFFFNSVLCPFQDYFHAF